jgi:chromosome segregation ATPase
MQGKLTGHRRDDRAEPDDDAEATEASRIDVVSVESLRGTDPASSGMVALRRELAKLNQQAAAVEKSLDDQRRERSESLERLEKERAHKIALEARVSSAEAETLALHKAHAKTLADLRASHDEAVAELRASHEKAIAELRAPHEKALAELRLANDERAVFEKASDAAKVVADEMRAKATKLEAETATARGEAAKHKGELAKAKADHAKTSAELTKAKEAHARERTSDRGRITALERAVDEASAATQRCQGELDAARATEVRLSGEAQAARKKAELLGTELEAARQNEERLARQLETALARAVAAESQALTISLSHASLEGSFRTLRDEIAQAFARVTPPAAADPISSSRLLPLTNDLADANGAEAYSSMPPNATKTVEPPCEVVPEEAKRSTPPPPSYDPKDPKFSSD